MDQDEREKNELAQLQKKAGEGSLTAIQILERREREKKLKETQARLMESAMYEKPTDFTDGIPHIPLMDFEGEMESKLRDLDISEIEAFIRTGKFKSLPAHMATYLSWMQIAHDKYYQNNGKSVIIKFLQSVCKDTEGNGITYYMANKVFTDMLSFFYSDRDFVANHWYMYLSERLMMGANLLWEMGDIEGYNKAVIATGNMIDKVKIDNSKLDPRLLDRRPRFLFTTAKELGIPEVDKNALAADIDKMNIPEKVKMRVKSELGTEERNLLDGDTLKDELDETK